MIHKIGSNISDDKWELLKDFYLDIKDKYDGYLYIGYPVYIGKFSNEPTKIDAILISSKGVLVIHISQQDLTDFAPVQDKLYNKIEIKLRDYNFLVKKRKLIFPLEVISICEKSEPTDTVIQNTLQLSDFFENLPDEGIDADLIRKINSAIQEAYGLTDREEYDFVVGTKSEKINGMNDLIEEHDPCQMEAILADPSGIQRIRGMAGSGKTIVLARKAVELHTAYPEWKILVTYNTRSVYGMIRGLIDKLYRIKNDGKSPDFSKLKIMHGWGSLSSPGVYYNLCRYYDKDSYTFTEARYKFSYDTAFEGSCNKLLSEIKSYDKLYDCILIDEAQDFPIPFFKLCMNNLGSEKRLVYAYDELQKLNEEAMATPQRIFGTEISIDTPLKVSYRNQSSVIVSAHAIGMGIYRDMNNQNEKLIQIPYSNDIWNVIGYSCDEDIVEKKKIELYRRKINSPDYLNEDKDSLVSAHKFQDSEEQFIELMELIKTNIQNEKVKMKDIMIIDLDLYKHKSNYQEFQYILNDSKYKDIINIHLAGNLSPEDFKREDSIVYSHIHRAKGNESYLVYIINCQEVMSNLKSVKNRNEIFTAITRSKGWVGLLGYGEKMEMLKDEVDKVRENDYKLVFKSYPTEEEKDKIRTTNVDLKTSELEIVNKMEKLLKDLSTEKQEEILSQFQQIQNPGD